MTDRPNIVIILADDLGYGDLSCYNPDGKIATPNLDRLAREGVRFTDAHANCAQCSPTRYGLLTGRYAWRTRLKTGVLPHFARPLIGKRRMTVASLLKRHGYATACIGKWHLGLGWQAKKGKTFDPKLWDARQVDAIDFGKPLTASPLDHGFDYYFGIGSSNNMLPYCFIENDRVVRRPTRRKHPVYDTENALGLVSDDYRSRQIDQVLWKKAGAWLEAHLKTSPDRPFFLYFPTSAIHRPCLPASRFRGRSKAGLHGDKVTELDDIVGRLMALLKKRGCEDNTLFIFTSDNGPIPGDPEAALKNYAMHAWGRPYRPAQLLKKKRLGMTGPEVRLRCLTYGHRASGPYLGFKMAIYEGGHRVPFIVRWPRAIKPGATCGEAVCMTDILATVAHILRADLPNGAGEDSYTFLPLLRGRRPRRPLREATILDSWTGVKAVRQGDWKLVLGPDAGSPNMIHTVDTPGQLYNIATDPGETKNLYRRHPAKVRELTALYEKYRAAGRSAPPAKFAGT